MYVSVNSSAIIIDLEIYHVHATIFPTELDQDFMCLYVTCIYVCMYVVMGSVGSLDNSGGGGGEGGYYPPDSQMNNSTSSFVEADGDNG